MDLARGLANVVVNKFLGMTGRLSMDISRMNPGFAFLVVTSGDETSGQETSGEGWSNTIRPVAEKLKYDPNFSVFRKYVALQLKAGAVNSKIVVSFHGVGAAFRGLLVAVAYFQVGDGIAVPISEDVFRISYQETENEIVPRFEKWLEPCIVEGIAHWRRTLVWMHPGLMPLWSLCRR